MDTDLRSSGIENDSRTKSLMGSLKGSFKMAESMLTPGSNKKIVNLDIPSMKLVDKNVYKKQQLCQVCFITFGKLTRQHHCRICANAVCSSCSGSSINKERCCDVCAFKYSNPERQTTKSNIIFELQGVAILYVQGRNGLQQQYKRINQQSNDIQSAEKSIENSEKRLQELQKQLEQLKRTKQELEQQIANLEKTS